MGTKSNTATKKRQMAFRLEYDDYRTLKGWAREDRVSASTVIRDLIQRERIRRDKLTVKAAA